MIRTELPVINRLGLHARAATKLAQLAGRYASSIRCGKQEPLVDAKSVMSLMLLAASQHSMLIFEIDGEDEQQASEAITELLADFFGEGG